MARNMKEAIEEAARRGGPHLYRITVHAAGNPDYTVELRGEDEWKVRSPAMVSYPYDLSGQHVTYTIVEVE